MTEQTIQAALRKLAIDNSTLYYAGLPKYRHNFSRDSFIYGLLAGDMPALLAQIEYSAQHQGTKSDPETGEEKGKIHHELPGYPGRGHLTTYNACDTTALYLLAISAAFEHGQAETINTYVASIDAAVDYILNHSTNNLFAEDPRYCGASGFALNVTYWKDSVLNGAYDEPHYPIVYTLVHFQVAAALQRIGQILHDQPLIDKGDLMKRVGLQTLWQGDHFMVALDNHTTIIDAPSSDSLHSLLYLEVDEIPETYVRAVEDYSEQLMTAVGYLPSIQQNTNPDLYHIRYLWVFEQALLHAAAQKHNLRTAAAIAKRVAPHLTNKFPELFDSANNFRPAGDTLQLWSIGAQRYFKHPANCLL
jgi:glycogen debranching enzyme